MRIRKTVDFGNEKYITNINAPMYGNHKKRSSRIGGTSKAVKKLNENHAIDECEGILKMNFKPFDWHIALTYSDENYTGRTEEQVRKDKRNFLSRLKRRCQKLGIELKYLTMSEQGVQSKKWHHHFVLPQEIKMETIHECWGYGLIRILNVLYANGEFRGLAKYYVDKTKGGQKEDDRIKGQRRYSFSHNCVRPIITYETGLADTWLRNPRPPKGWRIKADSVYNSVDGWGGYPYQKYILVKIE